LPWRSTRSHRIKNTYSLDFESDLALGEILSRLEFLELRALLAVVEPHQHVALGDHLAFAIAELDDAA